MNSYCEAKKISDEIQYLKSNLPAGLEIKKRIDDLKNFSRIDEKFKK